MTTKQVFEMVAAERARNLARWGDQRHASGLWQLILTEEVGEVAEASLDVYTGKAADATEIVAELVQVAAVAVAWIEDLTRDDKGVRDE